MTDASEQQQLQPATSLAGSILSDKFQSDSKCLVFARVQEAIYGVKEAVGLSDSWLFGEGIKDVD